MRAAWTRGERRSLLEQLGRKAAERDELLAEVSRSHAAILALTGEVERLRAIVIKVDYDMYHLARAVEAEAEAERLRKDTEADSLAITDLEAEVERLREVAVGNHSTPDECPLWYDGCNCTVGALVHNFDRAERAEAALGKITGEPDIAKAQGIAHAALRDTAPAAE